MRKQFVAIAVCLALIGTGRAAQAAGSHTFSISDFQGTYAETCSGFMVGSGVAPSTNNPAPFSTGTSVPQTGTGTMVADGNGGFQATMVFTTGGLICAGTFAGGPGVDGGDGIATGYTVNSDGTGTVRGVFTAFPTPTTLPQQLAYGCPAPGGRQSSHIDEYFTMISPNEIRFTSIDSNATLTGTLTRQHGL
jgi:hypothetical protein